MQNSGRTEATPFWILFICLAVSFVGLVDRDLWTPDEPRDAAISLEMGRTGDLIIPHLAGTAFVEKPPMYFVVAGYFAQTLGGTFGNTGAIRLSTAAWGIGTLLMTFFLGRRLMGRDGAILATAILATMAGFVINMHWIRVDAALVFFVAAAVWAFAETYIGGRRWLSLAGGLFTAGAFLSKGVIGPLLIGIAWLGLVAPWLLSQRGKKIDLFLIQHLLGLVLFILPVGYWMLMLRRNGGEQLWHAWYYDNNFGRFSGTATELGHMHSGEPFYYVKSLLIYSLPWLPAVVLWFFTATRDLLRPRAISPERIFLGIWIVGTVVLLSISVTKREIYLAPLLPALALICAEVLAVEPRRWTRYFFNFWAVIALLILASSALAPLWVGLLPTSVPARVAASLHVFGPRNILAGLCFAACIAALLYRRTALSQAARIAAITTFLAIGFFAVPARAINAEKELGSGTKAFGSRIPQARRAKVAGWSLSETSRAMLYYYCDWTVPIVADEQRLRRIVSGADEEFDSVVLTEESPVSTLLSGVTYKVDALELVGSANHQRTLTLVTSSAATGREE